MKNKHKLSLLKTHYSKLPNQLFELKLPYQAIALYCFFVTLPEDFDPSVRFIGSKLNMSLNTVRKYIKLLEDVQIIQKYQAGGFKTGYNKYTFVDPKKWRNK